MMDLPTAYTVRLSGKLRRIAFEDQLWEVFSEDIEPTARAKLQATMQAYCDRGPMLLPKTRFRFEGHFEKRGKKVRTEAFKTRHVRIYGSAASIKEIKGSGNEIPTFLVTAMDVAKKSDKPNPEIVKSAGKKAFELIHSSGAKKGK